MKLYYEKHLGDFVEWDLYEELLCNGQMTVAEFICTNELSHDQKVIVLNKTIADKAELLEEEISDLKRDLQGLSPYTRVAVMLTLEKREHDLKEIVSDYRDAIYKAVNEANLFDLYDVLIKIETAIWSRQHECQEFYTSVYGLGYKEVLREKYNGGY